MSLEYDHQAVEKKWQKYWEENEVFRSVEDTRRKKFYVLDMFPYPSGAGLHVGHTVGYTATDIIARYRMMMGYSVLHPMGWDSFGLPAERYAIRTGIHPAITTRQNIDTFRRQLKSLGYNYDWSREISTCEPEYYKWTQWIFTKLFEKGLAYEALVPVNFCPALGTVLSNEDVENGKSIEGGHEVIQMPLKQWMLKITAYADRLLSDLDSLDWPESLKMLQRNWIGRSEGVLAHFPLEASKEKFLSVFTTRIDTIGGVSFMAVAPEHPLLPSLVTNEHKKCVQAYVEEAQKKNDFTRSEDKSGVFTGGYCLNVVTGEKIPVWVADYVLPTYGTGAVMGVPAHDARDFDFACFYKLPIKEVIAPTESSEKEMGKAFEDDGILMNSSCGQLQLDGLSSKEAREKLSMWLEEKGKGKKTVQYKLRDWIFSRQRYWGEPIPILHFADGSKRALDLDELPLLPPTLEDYAPMGDGNSPLSKVPEWVNIIDPKTGLPATRETNTMPQWAGSCWYYLRFCDPHNDKEAWNKEIENYWSPVDLYIGGAEHAVLHLLYARFWHKVLFDCGLVSKSEPFQALRNQGLVMARSFKESSGKYVAVEDVVEDQKVYVHAKTGEVLTTQIEKMSKSKLNGVSPDEMIEEYGADTFRLAVAFMGPLESEKVWSNDALNGCRRFLERAYEIVTSKRVSDEEDEEIKKLGSRLIDKTKKDLEVFQFNTIVAKMMEFVNEIQKREIYPKKVLEWFVQVLSLFAPHVGEELWQHLGYVESISRSAFPEVDPKYLIDDVVTYVVQVNGKVRGRLELPRDRPDEELVSLATHHPNVARFVENRRVLKTVVVPNKLLNFVVE